MSNDGALEVADDLECNLDAFNELLRIKDVRFLTDAAEVAVSNLHVSVQKAAALLRSPPVGEEWRSIATYEGGFVWCGWADIQHAECGRTVGYKQRWTNNYGHEFSSPPTHWLPLPAPPGASQPRPAITEDVVERVAIAIWHVEEPGSIIQPGAFLRALNNADDPEGAATIQQAMDKARAAISAMTGEKL